MEGEDRNMGMAHTGCNFQGEITLVRVHDKDHLNSLSFVKVPQVRMRSTRARPVSARTIQAKLCATDLLTLVTLIQTAGKTTLSKFSFLTTGISLRTLGGKFCENIGPILREAQLQWGLGQGSSLRLPAWFYDVSNDWLSKQTTIHLPHANPVAQSTTETSTLATAMDPVCVH